MIALSGAAEPAIFGKINMGLNMLQSLLLPFAMLPMLHFTTSVASLVITPPSSSHRASLSSADRRHVP